MLVVQAPLDSGRPSRKYLLKVPSRPKAPVEMRTVAMTRLQLTEEPPVNVEGCESPRRTLPEDRRAQ
jgi:hypothetical protein